MDQHAIPVLSKFFKSPMQPLKYGESKKNAPEFKLMLLDKFDGFELRTVDEKLQTVYVDSNRCNGSARNFLRAYNQLANNSSDSFADSIEWGLTTRIQGISLNDYPELLDMARGAIDIVDNKGNAIVFNPVQRQICMMFLEMGSATDEKSVSYSPFLIIPTYWTIFNCSS